MQKFDRETAKEFRTPLQAALDEVAKKFGVVISVGNCSFTAINMSYKIEIAAVNADGKVELKEAASFRQMAPLLGMKAEDLGRTFVLNGSTYTLLGYCSRRPKFAMLVEKSGKQMLLTTEAVKKGLGYAV